MGYERKKSYHKCRSSLVIFLRNTFAFAVNFVLCFRSVLYHYAFYPLATLRAALSPLGKGHFFITNIFSNLI